MAAEPRGARMARTPPVVAFTGGEVDSYQLARRDLEVSPTTAERLENISLTAQGAMELAPGTLFMGSTPNNDVAILRPWLFSVSTSRLLVFTDLNLWFAQGETYIVLAGAEATIGTFTDQSSTLPAGGDPAPEAPTGQQPPSVEWPSSQGEEWYDGQFWWRNSPDGPIFLGQYPP